MNRPLAATFLALIAISMGGCQDSHKIDPRNCQVTEAGEAADLLSRPDLPNDSMVRVQGITHPKALIWQDKTSGIVNYTTRVMGTGQRLFYLKTIPQGEKPGILSELTGHLVRWDQLPGRRMKPIAAALKQQYNISIQPEETYVIDGDGRPQGCPEPPH